MEACSLYCALNARSSASEPLKRSSSISAAPGSPEIVALFVNCQNVHYQAATTAARGGSAGVGTPRCVFHCIRSAVPEASDQDSGCARGYMGNTLARAHACH